MRWSGTGSNSWTNEPTDRTAGACSQIDARGSSWAPLFVHLLLHPLYSLLTLLILPHYTLRSRIEIKGVLLRLLSRCLRCSCCFYRCFLRFPPTLYPNPIFPPVFSPFVSYLYLTFLLRLLLFSFSFDRFSTTISDLSHRFLFDGIQRSIKSHRAFPFTPWRCPWANDRRDFHSNSRFSFREMETSLFISLVHRIISVTFVDTKNELNRPVKDSKIETISVAIAWNERGIPFSKRLDANRILNHAP